MAGDFETIIAAALGTEALGAPGGWRPAFSRASNRKGASETFWVGREGPESRLFESPAGIAAANRVGNESRTVSLVEELSVELMAAMIGDSGGHLRHIAARGPAGKTTLLVLNPALKSASESRRITREIEVTPDRVAHALDTLDLKTGDDAMRAVAETVMGHGPEGLLDTLWIAQPEVVMTRRPEMVPLAVPAPRLRLDSGPQYSTAGIYCRDAAGTVGISACLHGTGPAGTSVLIDGTHRATVTLADPVQDLVFVPLPAGCPAPAPATSLALAAGAPGQGDRVSFDGVTTGPTTTRVMGHDTGLLRRRPTVQLRVQTEPDSNQGDSGSALLGRGGELLGFAFEVTAPNDYPQFSDWVWAPNALAALGLTPL